MPVDSVVEQCAERRQRLLPHLARRSALRLALQAVVRDREARARAVALEAEDDVALRRERGRAPRQLEADGRGDRDHSARRAVPVPCLEVKLAVVQELHLGYTQPSREVLLAREMDPDFGERRAEGPKEGDRGRVHGGDLLTRSPPGCTEARAPA